jgi:hypothetical protein
VARQLKSLEQDHGREAAAALWGRYRYIRINDVIANPERWETTDDVLRGIQHELVERSQ